MLKKIETRIHEIRGVKVMLDFDLAELYEVETKNLNLAVKRNIDRFPHDFMFQLTKNEWNVLRLQIETSNSLRLQIETLKTKRGRHSKYLPYAFTEQGLAMLSGILNSKKAIQVNISIMRAFVLLRQYALDHKDLTEKLKEMENKYNKQFKDVYEAINYLLQKDKVKTPQPERKRIGFKL
jgi:ORF6N domain